MRQIALDTETTGLSTDYGHRIIEIGCIEIIDRKITGAKFHCYLDPDRDVDAGALAVHGLSNEFLKGKPSFKDIQAELLDFVAGSQLIIHNAPFDIGFLNHELALLQHEKKILDYCLVLDTLPLARQRHPGQKNNLDALCKRYEIDNTHRQLHGALLDADLLARLYLAMTGGQANLFIESEAGTKEEQSEVINQVIRNKPLPVMSITSEEQQAHLEFIALLEKNSGINLWKEGE